MTSISKKILAQVNAIFCATGRLLIVAASVVGNAFAYASDEPNHALPGSVGGTEIASMGIGLVLVIAAILVIGWVYSRMTSGVGSNNGVIDIVATRQIGPKERILLIDIANKQLLVGMTATQVQTLHVFDERIALAESPVVGNGFAERLRSAIREARK